MTGDLTHKNPYVRNPQRDLHINLLSEQARVFIHRARPVTQPEIDTIATAALALETVKAGTLSPRALCAELRGAALKTYNQSFPVIGAHLELIAEYIEPPPAARGNAEGLNRPAKNDAPRPMVERAARNLNRPAKNDTPEYWWQHD